ncbi:MAG TPA: Sir2 family NAD-dependent protein deacetylase [Candidatus Dormibacteraeota bacterium]|nr:Sir2 family NAD-dependent protein deacetylase [Candidatus Dormibacteraeota bacterium]
MSVARAAELVARARNGIALTGAGISAESGIPTFRGEGGLWRQYDPVKVATLDRFLEDPEQYWLVARERGPAVLAARPNPGHTALADLEAAGHVSAVVTQNTDGLHQDAGSKRVIQLHGTGRTVQCLDCGVVESRGDVQARLGREMPPRCAVCGGGFMKPTVVFFGEAMPADAMTQAFELARAADLMLVVGSSLVVFPAAEIPLAAAQAGVPLVIVNAEPTPYDELAEVVIHGRSGEVLPEIARLALVASGG